LLLDVKLCPTMMALSPAWERGEGCGRVSVGRGRGGVKSEENIGGNLGGEVATYLVERAVGRVADHDLVDAEAVLQVEFAEVHDLTARG
jgi:hypothetical protein